MDDDTRSVVLRSQRNELTEHLVYSFLARRTRDPHNRRVLERIASDERSHHDFWRSVSKVDVSPNRFLVWWYALIAVVFGLSFGLRLMEKGEGVAISSYKELLRRFPRARRILRDEERHEKELLSLISEQRLEYASAVVLGLNDALVELSGALAGFTFALRDGRLIGVVGLIMGVAAALSMAASGYLSFREDEDHGGRNPLVAAAYTGVSYIITVLVLVAPYFFLSNVFVALGVMLFFVIIIIMAYTFYISVAKSVSFRKRFGEMALISLGVAVVSFGVGWLLRSLSV